MQYVGKSCMFSRVATQRGCLRRGGIFVSNVFQENDLMKYSEPFLPGQADWTDDQYGSLPNLRRLAYRIIVKVKTIGEGRPD